MTLTIPGFRVSGLAALCAAVAIATLASSLGCADGDPPITVSGTGEPGSGIDIPGNATGLGNIAESNLNGISDDAILFGQSAAFSGPASELGLGMRAGILAAFNEANARGGVHGRRLELTYRDDAYEPEAAIENTAALIDEEKVFALVGAVGTPTSRSAVPVAQARGAPYVAPFTGAEFLRSPTYQHILNVRASYYQETAEMVRRLMDDLGITRIAVMFQDDSFGRAGYQGVKIALQKEGMEPVAIGIYPRNTKAIKTALLDLQQGEPEAVIMIGAYEPVAHLISWARHTDFNPEFMTVSFVGSNALARELGEFGEGVYVTQVVPFPWDDSIPIVADYHDALGEFAPEEEPGFVSLEGYIAGRFVVEVAERCGRDIDRECFLQNLRNGDIFDLGGFELGFGPEDSQGSNEVFLTVIGADGNYHPIDVMMDTSR
ncbi:MAG: ABC transporter substrate-binding protein [Chloroflexi bacterium]|nr:ABC transporter substrate-binding protein [Chloroflexota bacterium]